MKLQITLVTAPTSVANALRDPRREYLRGIGEPTDVPKRETLLEIAGHPSFTILAAWDFFFARIDNDAIPSVPPRLRGTEAADVTKAVITDWKWRPSLRRHHASGKPRILGPVRRRRPAISLAAAGPTQQGACSPPSSAAAPSRFCASRSSALRGLRSSS